MQMGLLAFLSVSALAADDGFLIRLAVEQGQCLLYETSSHHCDTETIGEAKPSVRKDTQEMMSVEFEITGVQDGLIHVTKRYISASVCGSANGIQVNYSSLRGDPTDNRWESPAYGPSHLSGQTYRMVLDVRGCLIDVLGFEDLFDSLMAASPDDQFARQGMNSSVLRLVGSGLFPECPTWTQRPGAAWSSRSSVAGRLPFFIALRNEYSFTGIELRSGMPMAMITRTTTLGVEEKEPSRFSEIVRLEGESEHGFELDLQSGIPTCVTEDAEISVVVDMGPNAGVPIRRLDYMTESTTTLKSLGSK